MSIINYKRSLVLATASEARRQLVADTGLKFISDKVDIDETAKPGEDVNSYVCRLANEKATACVPPSLDTVIIAVDTAIGLDGKIIGKPLDEKHARDILKHFSGRWHDVASAIALRDVNAATINTEVVITKVRFVKLDEQSIDWYISTGEWKGRAGAYAIQGKGAALIKEVNGCLTNVIGISIPKMIEMLTRVSLRA